MNQDAEIYASVLEANQRVVHELKPGRHAWIQVASGTVEVNGETLRAGDGASVSEAERLELSAAEAAEFYLFDLA